MAGNVVLYRNNKKDQVIRRRQSTATAISLSFPFVGVVQPAGWQGTTSDTKDRKGNDQAVTIDKNSDPVFLSFRRRRSTCRMAGHDVDHKMTKENDQAATIINNSDAKATINNKNLPLPRKSNNKLCELLSLIWSECILRTNGVENIPHFRCDKHVLLKRENANSLYYAFYSRNQSQD